MGIGCTIDGIARTLLLVPISTYTKFGRFDRRASQVGNFVHQNELAPYYLEYAPLWTPKQFATTPSTWGFCIQGLILYFK
jgi:hypothetical protein